MLQPKAYSKEKQKVYDVKYIDFDNETLELLTEQQFDFYAHVYDFDEVEFMENTGLKDKHGDYVYVGSILTDEGELGEDEWIYGIVTKDIDEGCYISWGLIEFSESLYECSAYSVVGNIYENKELLGNE
nr:MAG TPA: YopX protein [Caudoviricetes sp.]